MNNRYTRHSHTRIMRADAPPLTPLGARSTFWIAFWLLVALLVGTTGAYGQTPHEKLDVRLKLLTSRVGGERAQGLLSADDDGTIDLFIIGDVSRIRSLVACDGGVVRSIAGDVVVATVPMRLVGALAASGAVTRLASSSAITAHNELAARSVRADKVWTTPPAGEQAFTGKGVIVGVIDTGIDWTHPDFRDPNDTTRSRILTIWDHEDSLGVPPEGFTYGTVWSRDQIEHALRGGFWSQVRHVDSNGHGTHVAGTAAGNGAALGRHRGIAPEADIAVVATRMDNTYIADAARYLVDYAAALGRPIVLNLSLGSMDDPRDGTAALDMALDAMLEESPGRVAVIAAGNAGAARAHAGGILSPDPLWTYVMYDSTSSAGPREQRLLIVAQGLVRTSDPSATSFAFGLDSLSFDGELVSAHPSGTSDWYSIDELVDQPEPASGFLTYADGTLAADFLVTAQRARDGEYNVLMMIQDIVGDDFDMERSALRGGVDYFRLQFKGAGEAHLWNGYALHINDGDRGLQTGEGFANWANAYTVTSPATANRAIAVGAYSNLDRYRNISNVEVPYANAGREGELAYFSSAGPSLDGRLKPEITAPGHGVISALTRVNLDNPDRRAKVVVGGRHIIYSGTSMASPVVAGSVALYLEKHPTATWLQVKSAITSNARVDGQTASNGPLPNNHWGYGKLDIYRAIYEGTSAARDERRSSALALTAAHPNPTASGATIGFTIPEQMHARLEVVDLDGAVREVIVDDVLHAGGYEAAIDAESLPEGAYLCRLVTSSRTLTQPIAIVR